MPQSLYHKLPTTTTKKAESFKIIEAAGFADKNN